MADYSLCILKPDIHERSLEDKVYEMIRKSGLWIGKKMVRNLTPEDVEVLYLESKHQHYYCDIVRYLTRGMVEICIVYGDNALDQLNDLVGLTDPQKADKDSIRGRYGKDILENSIHSSNENRVDHEIRHIFGLNHIDKDYLGIKL